MELEKDSQIGIKELVKKVERIQDRDIKDSNRQGISKDGGDVEECVSYSQLMEHT
jgi:hypothetical protein